MRAEQQVIVVGAGPVGLINAYGLARQGVSVTVVERAPDVVDSPRAVVYHWAVLDGLANLDLLEEATAAGFLKQDYAYRVHKTGEEIRFGVYALDERVERPYNLHLGQGALGRVIVRRLEEFDNVRVLWAHEVTAVRAGDDGVEVTIRPTGDESGAGEQVLSGEWLIGADGAGSTVRTRLDLGFEGMTWPERFVASNVRFPDFLDDWSQTTFNVDDVYGAIIAKIDETGEHGLWRYTYMEDDSLPTETLMERFPAFLQTVFGEERADGAELEAISPYRMHQRSANTYRAGRVLLAGDAAHATNPSGGLGLTSGLFDSYVLQEALGAVIRGRTDDAVLDAYAAERRRIFLDVASPRATANKLLVFHSGDPAKLDDDLEFARRMSRDREFAAERLYFPKTMETPSLITT